MNRPAVRTFLLTAAIALLTSCQATEKPHPATGLPTRIHYIEIVCPDVDAKCAALARIHGFSFGKPVADLGLARVAEAGDGSFVGVRAPMAEHEQPVVRTYLEVDDMARAVKNAEAAGGVFAYGPTTQGDTGTWAIYFLGDIQLGLWHR
jgi:hypothetical protein